MIIDMNLVKSKLNDLMYEQWSNEVHNKPKLRTYVQIKDTFEPEPCVLSNISRQRRSLLTQIRLGILPIKIETGRFRSFSVDQRIYVNCVKVQNKIHFICECPLYNDFRETLYEHAKLVRNDFTTMGKQGKFVQLVHRYIMTSVNHCFVLMFVFMNDKIILVIALKQMTVMCVQQCLFSMNANKQTSWQLCIYDYRIWWKIWLLPKFTSEVQLSEIVNKRNVVLGYYNAHHALMSATWIYSMSCVHLFFSFIMLKWQISPMWLGMLIVLLLYIMYRYIKKKSIIN